MKILLVQNSKLPVVTYEEAERVIWWLGKALVQRGHEVVLLAKKGSVCPFAKTLFIDDKKPLEAQIPDDIDLIHFHCEPKWGNITKPFLITCYNNHTEPRHFDPNTVFLSDSHARAHGAKVFVYPGIDWSEYGTPILENKRSYFHFQGNAAWRVKNVRGAIDIASEAGARLHVIGGSRVNFRQGLRITLSPNVRFHGTLNPEGRNMLLNNSRGLIYPVVWQEPFGIAAIESLYFGAPVFGTPYGALNELLGASALAERQPSQSKGQVEALYAEFGCLSLKKSELVEAVQHASAYNRQRCHEYAHDRFSATRMANDYLKLYEKVLDGKPIHEFEPVLEVGLVETLPIQS